MQNLKVDVQIYITRVVAAVETEPLFESLLQTMVSTWTGWEGRARKRRRRMMSPTIQRSRGGRREWKENSGSENRSGSIFQYDLII